MKKRLFFFAAVACLALAACSNGDDEGKKGSEDPVITLEGYEEPYMVWGVPKATVKHEVPYRFLEEKSNVLSFEGVDMVSLYMYAFDDNGLLASSATVVSSIYTEEIADFLTAKYQLAYVDKDEYEVGYVNKDQTLFVLVGVSLKNLLIMYAPLEKSGTEPTLPYQPRLVSGEEDRAGTQKLFEALVGAIEKR